MMRRAVLACLALALAWPSPAMAMLSRGDATTLLTSWLVARGTLRPGCGKVQSVVYKNLGYTMEMDATACGGGVSRWRLDALTSEVFQEDDRGKFVLPAGAAGLGNVACLAGAARLLGAGAVVLGCALPPGAADRAMVLWMRAPTKQTLDASQGYTCPDMSRGSHHSGPTRLSLVDTARGVVRNTLEIQDPMADADSFDLPWRIQTPQEGSPYAVPEPSGRFREGRPDLLALRDLNGDGLAAEFHLASADNCMLQLRAVFGYRRDHDAVASFPVRLQTTEGTGAGGTRRETATWLNFWPVDAAGAPAAPGAPGGRYAWEVDTRGRGGCLDVYALTWDAAAHAFTGTLRSTDCQAE